MSDETGADTIQRAREALEAGEPDRAAGLLDAALADRPDDPDLHYWRGLTLLQQGDDEAATYAFQRVLAREPGYGLAHFQLGTLLRRQGRAAEAMVSLQAAARAMADPTPALREAAHIQRELGDAGTFVRIARSWTRLKPMDGEAWGMYGDALLFAQQADAAVLAYRRSCWLQPAAASAHNALGVAYQYVGRLRDAAGEFREAARLAPDNVTPAVNLSSVLYSAGRSDESMRLLAWVLRHAPDHPGAVFAGALARLAEAPDELAWRAYEARTQTQTVIPMRPEYESAAPTWDGAEDPTLHLLVVAEQGFGDTFMFARYLSEAARRVGRLSIVAPRPVLPMLAALPAVADVGVNNAFDTYPEHDAWLRIASLPLCLRQFTPDGTNPDRPWMGVPETAARRWRERFPEIPPGERRARVGLVWRGGLRHLRDRCRSMDFEALRPLIDADLADFYVLQPNHGLAPGLPSVHDISGDLADFADTAGALARLDLLITVDTAVANLAGAMGKPFWVLLDVGPDWRWGLEGDASPWYPTARLFRQADAFDWSPVIAEVIDALREWVSAEGFAAD